MRNCADKTDQALEDVLTDDALGRPGHLQREVLVLGVNVRPEELHPSLQVQVQCNHHSYHPQGSKKNHMFTTLEDHVA